VCVGCRKSLSGMVVRAKMGVAQGKQKSAPAAKSTSCFFIVCTPAKHPVISVRTVQAQGSGIFTSLGRAPPEAKLADRAFDWCRRPELRQWLSDGRCEDGGKGSGNSAPRLLRRPASRAARHHTTLPLAAGIPSAASLRSPWSSIGNSRNISLYFGNISPKRASLVVCLHLGRSQNRGDNFVGVIHAWSLLSARRTRYMGRA
jgi:hypothetical protein